MMIFLEETWWSFYRYGLETNIVMWFSLKKIYMILILYFVFKQCLMEWTSKANNIVSCSSYIFFHILLALLFRMAHYSFTIGTSGILYWCTVICSLANLAKWGKLLLFHFELYKRVSSEVLFSSNIDPACERKNR